LFQCLIDLLRPSSFSILFFSYSPSVLSHNCAFQSETDRAELFFQSLSSSSSEEIPLTTARGRFYGEHKTTKANQILWPRVGTKSPHHVPPLAGPRKQQAGLPGSRQTDLAV
jgi:hypothetical protein